MSADKSLTANTSAIYVSRSFGYEKINELRLINQAFIFNFEHHFKTTLSKVINGYLFYGKFKEYTARRPR